MAAETLVENNVEFDVNNPETWLTQVDVGDGVKVNVPVMLIVAKDSQEQSS